MADDGDKPTCDWFHKLTPAASSALGKAIKPQTDVVGCRRNCGLFSEPISGHIFDRAGKKQNADIRCKAPQRDPADRDDPASPSAKRPHRSGAAAGLPSGVMTADATNIPWLQTPKVWRDILDLHIAPSHEETTSADVAVKALEKATGKKIRTVPTSTAHDDTSKLELFRDLLRFVSPFEAGDVLPRAACVQIYLAAIDFNEAAAADARITIEPGALRRKDVGDPIRLENIASIQISKVMIDQGRIWFRAYVSALIERRKEDAVHYVKTAPGQRVDKDAKVLVWPLRWATVLLKSWAKAIQDQPRPAPIVPFVTALRSNAELPTIAKPIKYDLGPFLSQGGTLFGATEASPSNPLPRRLLNVLENHADAAAEAFYNTHIEGSKSMVKNYTEAIKLGVKVLGLPTDTKPTDSATQRGRQHPHGSPVASGAGAAAPSASQQPQHFQTRGTRAQRQQQQQQQSSSSQATIGPLPALPPAPAAGSGVPPTAPQQRQQQQPTAMAASTHQPSTFRAGGSKPTFSKCLGIGCTAPPPPGLVSYSPFCRNCGPLHNYNWVTGEVTRK